jgi:hypothetical protein
MQASSSQLLADAALSIAYLPGYPGVAKVGALNALFTALHNIEIRQPGLTITMSRPSAKSISAISRIASSLLLGPFDSFFLSLRPSCLLNRPHHETGCKICSHTWLNTP